MIKGSHHTKRTIDKMSIAKKGYKYPPGRVGWNKGGNTYRKGLTLEQEYGVEKAKEIREKLIKSHLGNSGYWEGKHFSEKHIRNNSEARKGLIPWNKELTVETDERVKQNIEASTKTIREQYKNGKKSPRLGFKATEETRRRNSEANKGEKHWNWKNGITPLHQAIRNLAIYNLWRKAIFYKNQWTCQDCGHKNRNINAHHLYPFSKLLEDYNIISLGQAIRTEELWDTNNGVTLCKECHNELKNGRPINITGGG